MLTRRRFLQVAAGACACCAAGTGYVAVQETTPIPAPFSKVPVIQPDTADQEPDVPILLVINRAAELSFGAYTEAILRAEGIQSFRTTFLDTLDPALLTRFSTVLLCPGPLTPDQAGLLERYVLDGGALLALHPDPQLAGVLGLRLSNEQAPNGYLRIRSADPLTAGITDAAFQVHVPILLAQPDGAETLADLTDAAGRPTGTPIVALNRAGRGLAAYWGYDPAHNIAVTRQGNPKSINQDLDPIPGIRTQDLFVGWASSELVPIPQADEQQRLLAAMLDHLCAGSTPLPRLWYFPAETDALLIATGDAHGLPARFVQEGTAIFERYAGTISVYYTPPPISTIRRFIRRTQGQLSTWPLVGSFLDDPEGYPTIHNIEHWREHGHGFGIHPFVEEGLEPGINKIWNDFLKLGYGTPSPTARTHRVLWSGWVDTARAQSLYGIRMNLDYYQSGPAVHMPGQEVAPGFLNGSGLALPFVDLDGTVLDIYQQHTHLVDEDLMPVFNHNYDQGLNGLQAAAISRRLLETARTRYPAALGLQFHFDPLSFGDGIRAETQRWIEGTLEYAAASRIPTISAERWLDFIRTRTATQMDAVIWRAEEQRLHIDISNTAAIQADPVELLVPLEHQGRTLREIAIDNTRAEWWERRVGGLRYAAVRLPAANCSVVAQYA